MRNLINTRRASNWDWVYDLATGMILFSILCSLIYWGLGL